MRRSGQSAGGSRQRAVALACLLLAAYCLLLSASAGAYRDEVYQRNKEKPIVTHITGESIDGITTYTGATFPVIGIVRIRYAGASRAFRDAQGYRATGRHDDAIASYKRAIELPATDPKRKFWVGPTCRFYIAECHLALGELQKAGEAYNDLLTSHPKTRFKPNAICGLGRVHFEAARYPAAYQSFEDLATLAARVNWKEWLYEAYVWQARTRRMQKKFGPALALVRKVIASADPVKDEDVLTQARAEEAEIHVGQGKYQEAIRLLNKLIERIGPAVAAEIAKGRSDRMQRTEARCYNALGQCYLKRSLDTKKKEDTQEALLAFLWTVVLYPNFPECLEALDNAATCFEKLGQRGRAAELRKELNERAPKTTR